MKILHSLGAEGVQLNRRWLLAGGVLAGGAAAVPQVAAAAAAAGQPGGNSGVMAGGDIDPADQLDPPRPPNLKRPGQVDARHEISYARSVPAACRVVADHFRAIATRDYARLARTLHFPFAIVENIDAVIVESAADLTNEKAPESLNFSPNGQRYTNHYSRLKPGAYDILKSLEIINFDPIRVNVAMTFDRYDDQGKRMQRCEGVYCVTNNDGRWAIQLASTIWTPDQVIGMVYQDAMDAAIRLRADHVVSYVDDNPSIDQPKGTRGPRVGITGGGIGTLMSSQQSDDQMSLFAVRGVKTRLSRSDREAQPRGPRQPRPADAPHEPKDFQNYKQFTAMGWAWGSPWVPKESRIIHHCANKVHRFSGVTRFNLSGEEESTSMEVAVIVRGTEGEWTSNGGLAYITMHDRLNDIHTA